MVVLVSVVLVLVVVVVTVVGSDRSAEFPAACRRRVECAEMLAPVSFKRIQNREDPASFIISNE